MLVTVLIKPKGISFIIQFSKELLVARCFVKRIERRCKPIKRLPGDKDGSNVGFGLFRKFEVLSSSWGNWEDGENFPIYVNRSNGGGHGE